MSAPTLIPTTDKDWRLIPAGLISEYARLALQFLALLIAFKINRTIDGAAPSSWILLPLAISAVLVRARFEAPAKPVVTLWTWLGLLSAVYSLVHYPLMPALPEMQARYAILLLAWSASIIAGFLCFRFPGLALLPPVFLLWSTREAQIITGLPITVDIDIVPLAEVSMCIGLGLLIDQGSRLLSRGKADTEGYRFVELLLLLAIGVHLANYYWSFVAKIQLDGSPLLWLTENNPAALFLVALDDDHILFSAYPALVEWTYRIIDSTYRVGNFLVLTIQALALVAFFLPKRWFILLLVAYDIMHLSLIVIGGLHFWPWIILNLIVAGVVASNRNSCTIAIKLIATVFIVLAPRFVSVTMLGWLDSSANNKLSLEAVDKAGNRYPVSTNFFTFYSYSLGHMDYRLPNPAIGFEVGSPNGGVETKRLLDAGRSCDVKALESRPGHSPFNPGPFTTFIRNYHRQTSVIYRNLGSFPYDLYPHHFYVPLAFGEAFRNLNKQDVTAYIYKQESVCLSFSDRRLRRNVVASSEYRIDIIDR